MKIVCISDTHGEHDSVQLPEADMIIHAGDFSSSSLQYDVEGFLNWFSSLNYKYKIFIAGNHDFLFERRPEFARSLIPERIVYLEETGVTIEGLNIWGTPITPYYYGWAFNRMAGDQIENHHKKIPDKLDILISHGPPYGILDRNSHGQHSGCTSLLKRIESVKPKYVLCGHIHEGYGTDKLGES